VFLLRDTLQVDLAFWPETEFGAIAPTFRLVSGSARERPMPPPSSSESLIGMAWLYALHARSSIGARKVWQAEYMISGVRDHVLALACVRHGVPAVQGRGMDSSGRTVDAPIADALVRSLDAAELRRAFASVLRAAGSSRSGAVDADLARRLSADATLSSRAWRTD
jgi:hypothetical protein